MNSDAIPSHWYLNDTYEFACYMSALVHAKLRGKDQPDNDVPMVLPSINIPVQQIIYAASVTDQLCAAFHNRSQGTFSSLIDNPQLTDMQLLYRGVPRSTRREFPRITLVEMKLSRKNCSRSFHRYSTLRKFSQRFQQPLLTGRV